MVMNHLDVISSKEGNVTTMIGTETFEIAEIQEIEATLTYNTVEVQALGARMAGEKIVGAKGEGKLKMYGQNPILRKNFETYLKTGKVLPISIKTVLEDTTSNAGRQTVLLKGVTFKSTKLFSLSKEDGVFEDETDFTFNDIEFLSHFKTK